MLFGWSVMQTWGGGCSGKRWEQVYISMSRFRLSVVTEENNCKIQKKNPLLIIQKISLRISSSDPVFGVGIDSVITHFERWKVWQYGTTERLSIYWRKKQKHTIMQYKVRHTIRKLHHLSRDYVYFVLFSENLYQRCANPSKRTNMLSKRANVQTESVQQLTRVGVSLRGGVWRGTVRLCTANELKLLLFQEKKKETGRPEERWAGRGMSDEGAGSQ